MPPLLDLQRAPGSGGDIIPSGRIRRIDADVPVSMVEVCQRNGSRSFGPETGLHLRYWASRWEDVTYPERLLAERRVTSIICDAGTAVGLAEFMEWECSTFLTDGEFWEHMDNHSMRAVAVAETLLSGWTIENVGSCGRVVEFSRLWMRPTAARDSQWADIVNAFIERRYRRSRKTKAAVMLLKPFPLEYEGVLDNGAVSEPALRARQAAMRRLYARTLGARQLYAGEWMWLPMGPGAPAPRKRRSRRFG